MQNMQGHDQKCQTIYYMSLVPMQMQMKLPAGQRLFHNLEPVSLDRITESGELRKALELAKWGSER